MGSFSTLRSDPTAASRPINTRQELDCLIAWQGHSLSVAFAQAEPPRPPVRAAEQGLEFDRLWVQRERRRLHVEGLIAPLR